MTIALAVYLYAMRMLPPDEMHKAKAAGLDKKPLDSNEWRAVLALIALFLPTTLFWATYEQQGNTIALWADENTDRTIDLIVWHGEIPVTWFQAFNPSTSSRVSRAHCGLGCRWADPVLLQTRNLKRAFFPGEASPR
jgi:proton-dependent oligopeptide transporter, POT family